MTVPAAAFLFMVWFLHSRHFKHGAAQQLVLPVAALATIACTWAGVHAVLYAGLVGVVTVTAGVLLAERPDTAAR